MTKKDFFRLLIKVFGLYNLVTVLFYFVPQVFSTYLYGFDLSYFLMVLGSLLLIIALFLFSVFNTDLIIKILKLDKNFDDDKIIFGNLNSYSIILISVSMISLLLIANSLPSFLFSILNIFKKEVSTYVIANNEIDYLALITDGLSIILGYLFLTNNKRIAKFLDKN
ncbi:hypothetical protein [Flavobacterium sp. 316]|uniref:hypothetical protein n=1 Tax=Flavobacterium sp. 316 TaxID=1603293 RepID=UPI000AB49D95|nr:hypothetical protein [Flavobacterium sp. 316]